MVAILLLVPQPVCGPCLWLFPMRRIFFAGLSHHPIWSHEEGLTTGWLLCVIMAIGEIFNFSADRASLLMMYESDGAAREK
jgi:hypothetical protein